MCSSFFGGMMNKYIAQLLLRLISDKESRRKILTAVFSIATGLLFLMASPILVLSAMKEMGAPSVSFAFDEDKLPSEISGRMAEADARAIEDALAAAGLRELTIKAQLIYMTYFADTPLDNFNDYAGMFAQPDDRSLIDSLNSCYGLDIDFDEFRKMYALVMNATINEYIFTNAEEKNSDDLAAWAVNAYNTGWRYKEFRYGDIDNDLHLRCADNYGLITGYLRYDPYIKEFADNGVSLFYTPVDSLDTMPYVKGIGLINGAEFGIYIGDGEVIFSSAMGGVQRQNISDGNWNEWCLFDAVSYPQEVYDRIKEVQNEEDESEEKEMIP